MASRLGLRANGGSSPLEGLETVRAQQAETNIRQITRREWWLWFSAVAVVTLSVIALALSSFPSFFKHAEHFYEIRADQARWAVLCLLLLFNGWSAYRQWSFRREKKFLSKLSVEPEVSAAVLTDTGAVDPVTGLHTKAFIEQQLGKEIARAKRQNTALSLATLHLDEFAEANKRYGASAMDAALKELARRLKRACRGSDFAARLASDDFLLVLPECNLGEVKSVLNRLGALEMTCSGRKVSLEYTTGWVDYQPGDMPSDLLKRASELLHLYENAAKDSFSATLAPH
jgi:diguanylate cyclase (GGDEF)-like protein